ncbi:transposase [Bacteroides xylanisolvens]|uniref:ISAon1 family transposase n=1 Tax=Bacteroides xylanisolvens TaxID=371601 RepID=UPI0021655CFC|nr:transposase [Bacteroides xylanisolvens]MCS3332645.1 transposase [Bacteroides xylanisolvens]MCS3379763.1 transposase [Bacteroides xylanisolvens]UVR75052.1 transposase [Bacteroides xylanisolvens]
MKTSSSQTIDPVASLSLFLPSGILDYFTLVNHVSQDTCFILYLEEKATIPAEYSDLHLHSKGFLPEIEVQDFPIRGKAVYLRIKRRHWEDPSTGQTYSRDWSLVTLDMAGSMQKIAKTCFPRAMQVIDRFHVQKLVYEAVQELRITYRWQVIKEENKAMKAAKEKGEVHKAEELENGDTLRQLLARSRYLLFKSPDKWTKSQKIRAELLFKQFEDIKHVYYYSLELGKIFSTNYDKDVARAKLALWYNKIEEYGYDTFTTVANSIENHYERILNFFVNRSTNAAAEAFNAKIKAFRTSFRGVVDMSFFLFRLAKVYA